MNNVESYYNDNAQLEWERFDRHRMEFAITRRALAQFLPPPPAHILDCGGGPGRYAIHLTKAGYRVTLLDLSSGNLSLARQKAEEAGVEIAEFIHGNGLDLSRFPDAHFDAILLLGPLYHLVELEDRHRAVSQALRVLRPAGLLFAAFISIYGALRDPIRKGYADKYAQHPSMLRQFLETHCTTLNSRFPNAWFAEPSEICPFMESCGLRTLGLLAAEGLAAVNEQYLNTLDEATFNFWADLNFRLRADPCLLGASDHLLYIGEAEE